MTSTIENLLKNNTLWIIRSVRERTADLSKKLLEDFIPEENIGIVSEVPFTKAIKKTFETGIQHGLKWTVCLDGDVLPLKNHLIKQIQMADALDEDIFCIQGLVIDKLIPIRRPAGNHIYRTSLLEKALPLIPGKGVSTRPESTTTQAMKDKGYFTYQTNVVVGLHDYEQYYSDIFRKTFIHAHKHQGILARVETYWRENKDSDTDYKVALLGSLAGKVHEDTIYIDKRFKNKVAEELLDSQRINEKKQLPVSSYNHAQLEEIYANFNINMPIQLYKTTRYRENYVRDMSKERSIYKYAAWGALSLTGRALSKTGRLIQAVSNQI